MNRYFFTRKNGEIEQIGLQFATSRHQAAQLFSIRKGLKLKEFLSIYSVYNVLNSNIDLNKRIGIIHEGQTYVYLKNKSKFQLQTNNKNGIFFKQFTIKKFIQFLNWIQKEWDCKISN